MHKLIEIPEPKIICRKPDRVVEMHAMAEGYHPVVARVLASRKLPMGHDPLSVVDATMSSLFKPDGMADIGKAVMRVAKAIVRREMIAILTDIDSDGLNSSAVLYRALVEFFGHPKDRIVSHLGSRLLDGYGLSDSMVQRVLSRTERPGLLITADCGSSDEDRIRLLARKEVDVIVTDHHELPASGIPASAYACLNPGRPDCGYGDPLVAGCMVAWLLMAATRQELVKIGCIPESSPKLGSLMDYVAIATIGDVVPLGQSVNNRLVVKHGIPLIGSGSRPCWRALKMVMGHPSASVDARTLAFGIGPRLNSAGRMDSAYRSLDLLLSGTDEEALAAAAILEEINRERKEAEKRLLKDSIEIAFDLYAQRRLSIVIFMENGLAGIQGIIASRIKDLFGMPVIMLSPGNNDEVVGSGRSIDEVHLRDALQRVEDSCPGLFLRFGGHRGAAGLTMRRKDIVAFIKAFEDAVSVVIGHEDLGSVIWTDGKLTPEQISLETVNELKRLEPFGQGFPLPLFEGSFTVEEVREIGDGTHLKLALGLGSDVYPAVWFRAKPDPSSPVPVQTGCGMRAVYSLEKNVFRGNESLQIQLTHVF